MTFRFSGRSLRAKRVAAGLKVEHVALEVGRSAQTVESWESGRVDPPSKILCALAELLGCHPGDLFDSEVTS